MTDEQVTYRFLCTSRAVVLGPYGDDEIQPWLRGIETLKTAHGTAEPIVIRATTREAAEAKLKRIAQEPAPVRRVPAEELRAGIRATEPRPRKS